MVLSLTVNVYGQTKEFFDYSYKTKSINIRGNTFEILYGDNTIYIRKEKWKLSRYDKDGGDYGVLGLATKFNGENPIKNKYVKIGEETNTITFSSSNEKIIKFRPATEFSNQGFFTIYDEGQVSVFVKLDTATVEITLNIVKVPLKDSFLEDEIIDALGLPDYKNNDFIKWPNSKIVDGLFYSTTDRVTGSVYGVSVNHWAYKKYPGLIIRLKPTGYVVNSDLRQPAWEAVRTELLLIK